ncbi:YkvA family protein [Quadrisphaera sp. DSM 44207]|uniref:YkvA family protein n=1 Tax=Quadrisphaera sp. DSM 44207 TaxID=1881057 RepID=UPI000890245B|nr:YkvA family protein [Quadrisphaera sp. DSM 44207]SDQ50932.1 Uncharacterized membrane protein YkvA, DUF1232 family [Quadrisphaera sp. DSM 44207]
MRAGGRWGRRGAAATLWAAVRKARTPGSPSTGTILRTLPRLASAVVAGEYTGLSRSRLALMGLAGLYVASPVDLVPSAVLPVIGMFDDAVVLSWLAGAVVTETAAFLDWESSGRPAGSPGARAGDGGGAGRGAGPGTAERDGTGGTGTGTGTGTGGRRRPPTDPDVVVGEVID